MASDYAIEYTRRTYGNTTADSRYDSNTFILCLQGNYSGGVEFANSDSFMIYDPVGVLHVGQSVTISGSASNNYAVTINNIQVSNAPGVAIVSVNVPTPHHLASEIAPSVKVQNGTSTITYTMNDGSTGNFDNVPVIFVGGAGAILLDTLPIYGSTQGDHITISNSSATSFNGTYIISMVVQPLAAQSSDQVPVPNIYFPMVIFSDSSTPLPFGSGVHYVFGGFCQIADHGP